MLSRGEDSGRTEKLLSGIVSSVTEATARDESERRAHDRLLEIANRANGHRDERLALSVKRIPRPLLLFVTLTACTILYSALFYPFHNLALGIVAISLTTMLLCFAHFVLTDLDHPFDGTGKVDAKPFDDLATK
jgi:hypothetical protein